MGEGIPLGLRLFTAGLTGTDAGGARASRSAYHTSMTPSSLKPKSHLTAASPGMTQSANLKACPSEAEDDSPALRAPDSLVSGTMPSCEGCQCQ